MANEEAAEEFYNKAADRVSDETTQDVLLSLASDEREHKAILLEFKAGQRSLPTGTARWLSSTRSRAGSGRRRAGCRSCSA